MATRDKMNIELDVETMQELESSLRTLAKKIRWSLDNTTVRDPVALKQRLDIVERAMTTISTALEKRLPKAKTVTVLKAVK